MPDQCKFFRKPVSDIPRLRSHPKSNYDTKLATVARYTGDDQNFNLLSQGFQCFFSCPMMVKEEKCLRRNTLDLLRHKIYPLIKCSAVSKLWDRNERNKHEQCSNFALWDSLLSALQYLSFETKMCKTSRYNCDTLHAGIICFHCAIYTLKQKQTKTTQTQ